MNTANGKSTTDLQLAFDVGHSSIGWAVLEAAGGRAPILRGCGSVIFPADDCLASERRAFRRQRRHIRATRLRLARMRRLLAHLGVLTQDQLEANEGAWPWLLAARVLRGGNALTWNELWEVLRWYAHNRGYDGNKGWSRHDAASAEDTEKEQLANELLDGFQKKHGRAGTMAEVFCEVLKIDPLGAKKSSIERVRNLGAAFPREGVEAEVDRILRAHLGGLPLLDERFIEAVMRDYTALPGPDYRLPSRYGQRLTDGSLSPGGLLFGQLVPRFDNRIIARCPITFERVYQSVKTETGDEERAKHEAEKQAKVPGIACVEFHRFRWAMQLANVQVATGDARKTRRLSIEERAKVDAIMREHGALTPPEFRKAVRGVTGGASDNLGEMLVHPDAERALVVDAARDFVSRGILAALWPALDERTRAHTLTNLRRGKAITARSLLSVAPAAAGAFERWWDGESLKKPRKDQSTRTREQALDERQRLPPINGRAPFSREVLLEAADFIFTTNRHPAEGAEGAADNGPLFRSEAIRRAQIQRAIDEQTNNHLVRHRLRLLVGETDEEAAKHPKQPRLNGLFQDLVDVYAGGDRTRIARFTIEVNRDVREMSGKDRVEIAESINKRLFNFKSVEKKLKEALGDKFPRTGAGSLLRKARVLDDLDRQCPYTGHVFEFKNLLERGKLSLDHIVPHSDRKTSAMDALVVTFSAVNDMKGKRTALRFIEEFGGQAVKGMPGVMIRSKAAYLEFVNALRPKRDPRKDSYYKAKRIPIDDDLRKWLRKAKLQLRDYVEKEFTAGDLTQTSQLVRLAAQALQKHYVGMEKAPVVVSLPGSVTGAIRKSWNIAGCLALANPLVLNPDDLDENGKPRVHRKTELRGITHLHHALDACVLGFISEFLPRDGGAWKKEVLELLSKRRLTTAEQAILRAQLREHINFTSEGEPRLCELSQELREQLRQRLAECRVVQHIPAEMAGLPTKETVWRVFDPTDPHASTHRLSRWLAAKKVKVPESNDSTVLIIRRKRQDSADDPDTGGNVLREEGKVWRWVYAEVEKSKVLGLDGHPDGKLRAIKGGKLIADNYGMALLPNGPKGKQFQIIRFFRVWQEIEKLRAANGGHRPAILRRGQLVTFHKGKWAGRVWRILGIEENGRIRFFEPDKVRRIDKPENYQKAQVTSLLRDGVRIVKAPLCGVAPKPTED